MCTCRHQHQRTCLRSSQMCDSYRPVLQCSVTPRKRAVLRLPLRSTCVVVLDFLLLLHAKLEILQTLASQTARAAARAGICNAATLLDHALRCWEAIHQHARPLFATRMVRHIQELRTYRCNTAATEMQTHRPARLLCMHLLSLGLPMRAFADAARGSGPLTAVKLPPHVCWLCGELTDVVAACPAFRLRGGWFAVQDRTPCQPSLLPHCSAVAGLQIVHLCPIRPRMVHWSSCLVVHPGSSPAATARTHPSASQGPAIRARQFVIEKPAFGNHLDTFIIDSSTVPRDWSTVKEQCNRRCSRQRGKRSHKHHVSAPVFPEQLQ